VEDETLSSGMIDGKCLESGKMKVSNDSVVGITQPFFLGGSDW